MCPMQSTPSLPADTPTTPAGAFLPLQAAALSPFQVGNFESSLAHAHGEAAAKISEHTSLRPRMPGIGTNVS